MTDDQNSTQNQDSIQNSIPPSPQEPIADAPIPPIDSEPVEVPSDVLESSPNDFSVKSNDIPPSNSTLTEAVNEPKTEAKQAENEPSPEPVSEPMESPEPETAQMAGNEPLSPEPEPFKNTQDKPLESAPVSAPQPQIVSAPVFVEPQQNKISFARELLVKARNMIQFRKRKKLDRVMALFLKKYKITNNEVEKFLHVSDATATRYLSQLEKENRIKQVGKTGKGVSYSRI